MATDKKISDLTVATTPSGAELVEIVQGGVNKQTTLQAIADLAGDEHFLGVYVSEAALISAHATASSGDYAFVDAGAASPVELWIWDNDDSEWVQTGSGGVVPPASETTQGIAELATQAETNTGTDDVRAVTPLKLNTKLRLNRTVTGADALEQDDDNSIIIFNSATDFNFTLDQLTASSKISFLNIGAGAVTFVAGTGVTVTPTTSTLMGASGDTFPNAFVFYHTSTTPRVVNAYPDTWVSWSPTFTGFSADPTAVNAHYTVNGKTCIARLHMTPGTSNATGQSVTLPFASAARNAYSIIVTNNGITQFGRCDTAAGSNILTLFSSAAGGAFTNSGNKGCFFVITYEID